MALLGNLTGSAQYFSNELFYNGVATTSLRFDYNSSHYLYRTPGTAGNRRTWTFSFWLKKQDDNSNNQVVISTATSEGDGTSSDGNTFSQLSFKYATSVGWYDFLQFYNNTDGGSDYSEELKRSIRDTTSWYHIVMAVDTTQSTAGNRVKYYVNGELQTSVSQYYAQIPQNYDTYFNMEHQHWIGRSLNTNSIYFNGYLAEINFVDGTQYAASDFGEFKNGVWIAKNPSVTYGTNGYRLQFKQTGTGTASASTIGADTSGNNNHWTSGNLSAHDVTPDSPENNFATWNPLKVGGGAKGTMNGGASNRTFTEGNLSVSLPANTWAYASQICPSGKWYVEICIKTIGSANGELTWGWQQYDEYSDVGAHGGYNHNWQAYYHAYGTDSIRIWDDGSQLGSNINLTISAGDVLQLAWDIDNRKGWIGLNNTWYAADNGTDGNPSAGTNQTFDFTEEEAKGLAVMVANGTSTDVYVLNCGQDSSFAGTKTAQGNTDVNGIGDFFYAVPTGFQALCASNLSEPTIGPNSLTNADDHFDTLLYTGNNEVAQDIGGLEFKPDWVWIKGRSYADHHALFDSSRGVGQSQYTNGAYTDGNDTSMLDEFRSDGFGVGTDSSELVNKDSNTYVAWNWKANGGTTTTNDASATSVGNIDSVYQANTTAGFSIVLYTGNGTNNTDLGIAHGLGVTPKMVWVKNRSTAKSWQVYNSNLSADATYGIKNLLLDTNGAEDAYSDYIKTTSSTTFTIRSDASDGVGRVNKNGDNYVAYCFAEVEGYSKIGKYTGNGNADGTFVFTGFRPAWVILKNTARSADWRINDATRQDINDEGGHLLLANSNSAEITNEYDIDFLSNGFKLRSGDVYENGSDEAFVYMAFAEAPFKYANAR